MPSTSAFPNCARGFFLSAQRGFCGSASNSHAELIRVNLRNGVQEVLARGRYLRRPQAIAASGDNIYIGDVAAAGANSGAGRVIHVDSAAERASGH